MESPPNQEASERARRRPLLGTRLAMVLYVAACLLPSLRDTTDTYSGYWVLVFGGTELAWYANLAFFVGVICVFLRRFRMVLILGSIGAIIAGAAWRAPYDVLVGYFFWHASMVTLAIAGWIGYRDKSRAAADTPAGSRTIP